MNAIPSRGPGGRKKRADQDAFSHGGEGGSFSPGDTTEPILLAPGTTVKEALLIIHFRLDAKGDLDSM